MVSRGGGREGKTWEVGTLSLSRASLAGFEERGGGDEGACSDGGWSEDICVVLKLRGWGEDGFLEGGGYDWGCRVLEGGCAWV